MSRAPRVCRIDLPAGGAVHVVGLPVAATAHPNDPERQVQVLILESPTLVPPPRYELRTSSPWEEVPNGFEFLAVVIATPNVNALFAMARQGIVPPPVTVIVWKKELAS